MSHGNPPESPAGRADKWARITALVRVGGAVPQNGLYFTVHVYGVDPVKLHLQGVTDAAGSIDHGDVPTDNGKRYVVIAEGIGYEPIAKLFMAGDNAPVEFNFPS